MVEPVKTSRVQQKEMSKELDQLSMKEAFRHGNIYDVLAKSKVFKASDFNDFFTGQWRSWKGQVVQDAEIKSSEATYHEPDKSLFPIHHTGTELNKEDAEYLGQSMANYLAESGGKFKASKVWKAEGAAETEQKLKEGTMTPDELEQMAQGTVDEWNQFVGDAWSQIIDFQMMSDIKTKTAELQKEVDRLTALAKQGSIGVEFVLLAMMKITETKNGILFAGLGKKVSHINESMNNLTQELGKLDPSDPMYAAQLQISQNKTRDSGFQMQLLTTDMQKLMQDSAGRFDQVQGITNELNRMRREIISQLTGR